VCERERASERKRESARVRERERERGQEREKERDSGQTAGVEGGCVTQVCVCEEGWGLKFY